MLEPSELIVRRQAGVRLRRALDLGDLVERLVGAAGSGSRLAYWNMLVPRQRPESMASQLRSLSDCAKKLHQQDKAFFYSSFVLEEVV